MTQHWNTGAMIAGLIFALFGAAVLLDRLDVWDFQGEVVLPLVLIALGAVVVFRSLVAKTR